MKETLINNVLRAMQTSLSNAQLMLLRDVLNQTIANIAVSACEEGMPAESRLDNGQLLALFLEAKRVEGCSEKTVRYYEITLKKLFSVMNRPVTESRTEELRT